MTIRYVLWDFGDTLVDQTWMLQAPDGFAAWPRVWRDIAFGELEGPWNLGEVDCETVADQVAKALRMSLPATLAHIRECCANIRFFDGVYRAARECSVAQAIVTINPDVFTNFVVPIYELDRVFPVIVTSWQEKTLSKASLCTEALRRLGGSANSEALLIDNIEQNVREWEQAGGRGYWFRGETQFLADLHSSLSALR